MGWKIRWVFGACCLPVLDRRWINARCLSRRLWWLQSVSLFFLMLVFSTQVFSNFYLKCTRISLCCHCAVGGGKEGGINVNAD